jgi:FixJ family two-component response regulator
MSQDKVSVAVVDDDQSFLCALERRFRVSGFEVRTYLSAECFLAPTELPYPDCVVLDVQLGVMSGLDLQRRLGELGIRSPVIFVTAYDAPAIRKEAEQAGCSAFFLKPVTTQLLIEAVNRALGRPPSSGGAKE